MKEHEFINLPIPEIEQYSLVVPIENIEQWKKKNWKTYQEIGLPAGEEEAWILYGDFDKESQILLFNKPESISEIDSTRLIGRKITAIKKNIGTYGMGGAGYFGLLLDDEEYLVYTIWSADRYVHFNDEKDIIGASISDYTMDKHSLIIHLDNDKIITYDFKLDFVLDDESNKEKPDDISKYLYFKLKEANYIV